LTRAAPIDAEAAARAVLAGTALGQPKQASGVAASLRQLRAARQAAVKARTQATNQLRALLLDAPEPLRALRAQPNSPHLAAQLARLRPAPRPPRPTCSSTPCAASPAAGWRSTKKSATRTS